MTETSARSHIAIRLKAAAPTTRLRTAPGAETTGTAKLVRVEIGAPPVLLESGAGSAVDPQVAVDPNGNATVVWHQHNGTRDDIWSNRFE